MRKHYDTLIAIGCVASVFAMVGLAFYMKYSVWSECRVDHSWFYCLHLVNGR